MSGLNFSIILSCLNFRILTKPSHHTTIVDCYLYVTDIFLSYRHIERTSNCWCLINYCSIYLLWGKQFTHVSVLCCVSCPLMQFLEKYTIHIYLIEKGRSLFRIRKGWIEFEAWRIVNTHCKVSGKAARHTREQQSVGFSFTVSSETNACPHFKHF